MGADQNDSQGQGQPGTPASPPEGGSGQQGTGGGASDAARLDRLENKLDQLVGQAHAGSQQVVQDRLDGPGAMADEVRRQLEERDRRRAAEEGAAAGESRLAQLEQKVKDMAEKAPEPPVRRVEKLMGWR